ncbi:MAG: hypothetical protein IJ184_03240 [Alphaproteobacteria bacterium]|nr:hypothetical protein [Alphaproteobacteria bacterium]
MKTANKKGLNFLEAIDRPHLRKDELFAALFTACGSGDNVNANHVFFQDVIVKFNAQKARGMILRNSELATPSHYVDVALGKYLEMGLPIKQFNADLQEAKLQREAMLGAIAKKKAVSFERLN